MNETKMIHLCYDTSSPGGGVRTYINTLLDSQIPNVSNHVITSLKNIDQRQFKLVHMHQQPMVLNFRGECPAVYTLHDHSTYCISGSKYMTASGTSCNRAMSPLGCTWGRLVDRCGSRRPDSIIESFQRTYQELAILKNFKIPVITVSDYVRKQLIDHGLPPDQAVTLRHGIPIPKTAAKPLTYEVHQNLRLLFVGRIIPEKGLHWLLEALAQVDRRIHLDIAGEGQNQPWVEQLAKQLRVSDRVTWHGWCSSEKLDALYRQCIALVFPSLWQEPAGLVTLEAYARYRPVIASSVGGIPEHVRHEQTGILVAANDIKKLAAAITELAQDYQKTRRMGEQGYAWFMEEFTIDIHVQRLQKLYEKAIADFQGKNAFAVK